MSWWASATSAGLGLAAEEQRLGVDSATYYGVSDATIRPRLAHNIRVNPLGFGRVTVKPADLAKREREPCLADTRYIGGLSTRMGKMLDVAAIAQPDACFSGDEQSLGYWSWPHDLDWSDLSLRRFRARVEQTYGTLAAVNTAWDTEFATWDELAPMTLKQAQGAENMAPWLEFRRFMDSEFVGLFAELSQRLNTRHPGMRIGLSGMAGPSSFNGLDYRALLDQCSLAPTAYDGLQRELLRCWAGEDDRVAAWSGYDSENDNERYDRFHPWYMLVHGCAGAAYFSSWQVGYGPYRDGGMISVNGFASAHASWIASEMTSIRAGYARLLQSSHRVHPDVAVLFSMASLHAATVRKWTSYAETVYGVTQAVEDAGFQYDLLSPEDISSACLSRYKLLVLPCAYSLSEALLGEVRSAIDRGLIVFADRGLGQLDASGAPREGSHPLGRLVPESPGEFAAWRQDDEAPRETLTSAQGGGLLQLSSSFPRYAWFQLKGLAIETESQLQADVKTVREAWRKLIGDVLLRAKCRYGPSLIGQSGDAELADIEKVVFERGRGRIVVLLRKYVERGMVADGEPERVVLQNPANAPHGYDSRTGHYLGAGPFASVALRPSQVGVIAFLPYRVGRLDVGAKMEVDRLEITAQLLTSAGAPTEDHVFHVSLIGPNGQSMPAVEHTISAPDGMGRTVLPIALNDLAGTYTVVVRDVQTGLSGRRSIDRVASRPELRRR